MGAGEELVGREKSGPGLRWAASHASILAASMPITSDHLTLTRALFIRVFLEALPQDVLKSLRYI